MTWAQVGAILAPFVAGLIVREAPKVLAALVAWLRGHDHPGAAEFLQDHLKLDAQELQALARDAIKAGVASNPVIAALAKSAAP